MRERFVIDEKRIDIRNESISLYEIMRRLKSGKMFIHKEFPVDVPTQVLMLRRVAAGYPTRDIVAFQELNGNFGICMTPELIALINFYENRLPFDNTFCKDIKDPGNVESTRFDLLIVKPSDKLNFHLEIYNS